VRAALAAALALALAIAAGAAGAADRAPQLTLEGARAVFGQQIRPGTVFAVGPYRFRIKRSASSSPRPGTFVVEIETEPVQDLSSR
jgi:hypothetical protein